MSGSDPVNVKMTRDKYEALCAFEKALGHPPAQASIRTKESAAPRGDVELEMLAEAGYGRPEKFTDVKDFDRDHTCFFCDHARPDEPKDWREFGRLAKYPVLDKRTGRPTGKIVWRMICDEHRERYCS